LICPTFYCISDYRDDELQEYYEDEDDSNDEGNWRNDYPDEDPFIYENEGAEYCYGDGEIFLNAFYVIIFEVLHNWFFILFLRLIHRDERAPFYLLKS
jgi:hypothetical protein